ncbi:MAG TPA: zf-HC2 domain-containing protein, partial [Gemmatimonadaceae bacterium]|nr:zf-HC2 domain-containing protein [Gemmatimonadaceae bacterium]
MITPFESDDAWQDRLSEYVDGLLSAEEASALEAHLRTCENCRNAVAELRAVVDRLRSDRVDSAPENTWSRIASRLGTQTVQHSVGKSSTRYSATSEIRTLQKFAVAAVLTVTFVAGLWTGAALALKETLSTPPGWAVVLQRKLHIPSRAAPMPY